MMPSNYFSHNPNDLRNNYDEDDYSVTNYHPNANNYQNNVQQAPQSLMLQQHHFTNNRAPSYTNFSDAGVSQTSNKSQPQKYLPQNNNFNNNDIEDFNNNIMDNTLTNQSNFEANTDENYGEYDNNQNVEQYYNHYDNNPLTNNEQYRSPISSNHPSNYNPSNSLPNRPESRSSNNYLLKENRITPSPFPLTEGGVLNNSYRPQQSAQSRSQSTNQFPLNSNEEKLDLAEVIDLLSHHSDSVKANAAAYLQHLSYMDDNIKVQTRCLRGLPLLLDLVTHPEEQVHKAACGALRNLSYGKANDDNKREIVKLGGVAALSRLLKRSRQDDVQELVTGIIWNLSSCPDIKTAIIDESMQSLMEVVVIPLSGWSRTMQAVPEAPTYRCTTFRNATGVLRNVSSEGEYARRKMRACSGLIQSLFQVLLHCINKQDCDNKSIENCVCVLRNLSFALQEVSDPDYLRKRMATPYGSEENAGCFGNKSKAVHKAKHESSKSAPTAAQISANPDMKLLWSPRLLDAYLPLLKECSNPDTLEATAGAIQNVTACDWKPSIDFREAVRKQGGLAIITDLLNYSSDKVICSAATALRNLAIDDKNKDLIGKQSMNELVTKLPSSTTDPSDYPLSHHTLAALLSTLYEIIKNNLPFTKSLVAQGGVDRLVAISKSSPSSYSEKVIRYANHLLYRIWKHSEFQDSLKRKGWNADELTKLNQGGKLSAENTLNRPIMNQGYQDSHRSHLSSQNTLEYKKVVPTARDQELALDALQSMQLSDRYMQNNENNLNFNNNNNNINYLNNYDSMKKDYLPRQSENDLNRSSIKNISSIYNSQNNSNSNLNNINNDFYNQNYVSNSLQRASNSQVSSNNNLNAFYNQENYRLSSNTNASTNYNNTSINNYNINQNNYNQSYKSSANNTLNNLRYNDNSNNYAAHSLHNSQNNINNFSNTMQDFIPD